MKYNFLCLILIFAFIILPSNVYADLDESINLDDYKYVIYADYFGSSGKETKKLYTGDYLTEVDRIDTIGIINAVIDGKNGSRGFIRLYNWITSEHGSIMPVPSLDKDKTLMDKEIEEINDKILNDVFNTRAIKPVLSLVSTEGELWIKYITGIVNGEYYIIIFDESENKASEK